MKKRSIALLMAAMMAMSMAGCGSSASTEAPASDAAEMLLIQQIPQMQQMLTDSMQARRWR